MHCPTNHHILVKHTRSVCWTSLTSGGDLRSYTNCNGSMQTRQPSNTRELDNLEELLAAFKLMQAAAKPLGRSQSELAMAAVLNASKVVGGAVSQSPAPQSPTYKHPRVRSTSLPIGIPSRPTPPTLSGNPVQAVPLYLPRVNGSLTAANLASPQSDRQPTKTCLYKVHTAHSITCPTSCCFWACLTRCVFLTASTLSTHQKY